MDPKMRDYSEQVTLAALLMEPEANAWELSGLEASLFRPGPTRQIAEALIALRDSGKRIHWRRVRTMLRAKGLPVAEDVERLVNAIGTSAGLTAAVSRLHYARRRAA